MHPFPHSLALLAAIIEDTPPLAPEAALHSARDTHDRFARTPPASTTEIEDAIIAYSRVLWPYRKAFDALVRTWLETNEATAFTAHLPTELRERYVAFAAQGGSLSDIHDAARLRGAFSSVEANALCATLLETRHRSVAAVRAAIASDDHEYRKLIKEFQAIQHEIESHIAALRRVAEHAIDHPDVYREIMETVRMFERGLAQLAREPEAKEVCAAIEAYQERHAEARARRLAEQRPKIFG